MPFGMRRRPLRRRPRPSDSWMPRFRLIGANRLLTSASASRGFLPPLFESETPEPDVELPDAELGENEWREAVARESWRRQRRDK